MEKIGRGRLLNEIRTLVFLSQNLTSGKKNLTSGSGHYLMTYKVNGASFFFFNFQDFRVFYREIHFAVNGCRNMLIENHTNMITISHIHVIQKCSITTWILKKITKLILAP